LAQEITGAPPLASPAATAFSAEEFREWSGEWGDRLSDYGEGLVRGGEAI
jgi:hypothetical protein